MRKSLSLVAIMLGLMLVLSSCTTSASSTTATNDKIGSAKDGNEMTIEAASMKLVRAMEVGNYELVSTEELKQWIDSNEDMIIVDTMPAGSFEKNRIPGAVNAELPADSVDSTTAEQKEAFLSVLGTDKDAKIVLYCGFVGCERSHVGALIAEAEGYTNIHRQPGGIGAWLDAGYDVESGK